MTLPHEDLSKILETLREQNEQLRLYQQRLEELSVAVTSEDKVLRVTAAPEAGVTDIKFLSLSYRSMPPEQFAALLVKTIQEANQQVRDQMMEDLPDYPIEGVSSEQILKGEVSFEDMFPVEQIINDVTSRLFGPNEPSES